MKKLLLYVHLLVVATLFAHNYGTVIGTIIAGNTNPVPFANVIVEGHKKGGMASEFWHYTLTKVHCGEWQITLSSVGFRTINFPLGISTSETNDLVVRPILDLLPGYYYKHHNPS